MSTILVVDDSAVDRRLIGGILEKSTDLDVRFADGGAEALRIVRARAPNLVVTDLQMPEIDGLELVAALSAEFPRVPVVLVTAHGSEGVALKALRAGAASYVPKTSLAAELVPTIDEVLAVASARRDHVRVLEHVERGDLRFVLENDESLFAPLVHFVQDILSETGICDETHTLQVGMALDEALHNAMIHGNLEVGSELREVAPGEFWALADERKTTPPYCDRRIFVAASLSPEAAVITLRDEGPGFDHTTLPDPTRPENLERVSGRGVFLMRTFMDEVEFNDLGNEVRMTKHAGAASAASSSSSPRSAPS